MQALHDTEYRDLIKWLVRQRIASGLTQADLSQQLGKTQSFVSKYENHEGRLDIIAPLFSLLAGSRLKP
jgi:transcriptional regulator with XRE-family HTH domain